MRAAGSDGSQEGMVEFRTVRKLRVIDNRGGDSGAARTFQAERIGAITDYCANFNGLFATLLRINDRLQIGAVAGNQNCER